MTAYQLLRFVMITLDFINLGLEHMCDVVNYSVTQREGAALDNILDVYEREIERLKKNVKSN